MAAFKFTQLNESGIIDDDDDDDITGVEPVVEAERAVVIEDCVALLL